MISQEVKEFLNSQKLGYVASVSSDGLPNISPKGTIFAWTSEILAFADIRSPDTMKNLQTNPCVEINVIDPLLRKGFLFRGSARIIKEGSLFTRILNHYRENKIKSPINSIVLVDVSHVSAVTSPLYDLGFSEQEIKSKWKNHFKQM